MPKLSPKNVQFFQNYVPVVATCLENSTRSVKTATKAADNKKEWNHGGPDCLLSEGLLDFTQKWEGGLDFLPQVLKFSG